MSTRLYVIKRDGRLDQFNANKIKNAIYKALATYCSIEESNQKALYLTNLVTEKIIKLNTKEINIEAIQDIVEQTLISQNLAEVAKHYIIYRAKRTQARVLKSDTNKAISNIINIDAKDNDDKRENANINTDTTMGSMLKVGSTVMKEYNLNNLIKPKYAKMHRDGVIHLHDLDFMSLTVNCLQMPLRKLLDHGFSTGHGYLRTPSTIQTACSLTCIAIQSSQNDFFGGQAIPLLDYDLAPYVAKSFVRNLLVDLGFDLANNHVKHEIIAPADARIMLKRHFDTDVMSSDMTELITHCNNLLKEAKVTKEEAVNDDIKNISFFSLDPIEVDAKQVQRALYLTKLNTKQGMEALVHNLCTMNSRAGSQTPFSSVNFGTDTSWEGRMISDAILDAGDAGLGNHETAIFPITIFKMMKGVNDKGSPNYDLFEKACRVSAKRLLPNFQNCSATYNYKYYKPGHPETEVATMGCAEGSEVVIWQLNDKLKVTSFKEMWNQCIKTIPADEVTDNYSLIHPEKNVVKVYDSYSKKFVNVKTVVKNHKSTNFRKVTFTNGRTLIVTGDHPLPIMDKGRTFVDDLQVGDEVTIAEIYTDLPCSQNEGCGDLTTEITYTENTKTVPENIFSANKITRQRYLANLAKNLGSAMFDYSTHIFEFHTCERTLALQLVILAQSCGYNAQIYQKNNRDIGSIAEHYVVEFLINDDATIDYITNGADVAKYYHARDFAYTRTTKVLCVEKLDLVAPSYDVETNSDRFDLSTIYSHNCRTRVISNAFDPDHEICYGRGNLFWTTINLPYIALTARDQVAKGQNIVDKFYELLDDVMTDVIDFSLDRFEIVAKRKAKNYPFSMGQHEYVGSENLLPDDSIRNVLKEGSISIGIIGLAETLIVLCGKHHGESDEAQKLGLEIVHHMRARTDKATTDLNMNFSLMGSPAEGCTGRLCKAIKNKWGVIKGVTDKSYLVNSTHVPPSYKTTIYHKVKIEAPYHELENAGHICYVEQDADISKNPKAFEEIVTFMANENCGYIAINHPVSRDPICGYVGPMNKDGTCPRCGRKEFEGVPAWKLLSLHSYTPDPEYAVTADKIEDDATINDNLLHMGENK